MRALLPGRGGILVFVVTTLVGLAVWAVSTPAIAGRLFGEGAYVAAYSSPLLGFFGLPLLALVAAVAGYLLPRGFWLWGIAVVALHPLAEIFLTNRVLEVGVIDSSELGSLVFVNVMLLVIKAVACTVAAALGAGLRLLWWQLRGEPVGARLGLSSRNNSTA